MGERGFFAVDRGIWDDPDFAPEPYSEREAFLWLVGEAAWRATKTRVAAALIELERGQCAFSTRFLAVKWKWSEARVRRFLGRLVSVSTLCTETDAGATRITICNYDKFQHGPRDGDAPPTQTRRTSDAKKEQENKGTIHEGDKPPRDASARDDFPADAFDQWWAEYPHKVGKDTARKSFEGARKQRRATFAQLVAGLAAYRRDKPPDRQWCNPATWLNQGRWQDEPAPQDLFRQAARASPETSRDRAARRAREAHDELTRMDHGERSDGPGAEPGSGAADGDRRPPDAAPARPARHDPRQPGPLRLVGPRRAFG